MSFWKSLTKFQDFARKLQQVFRISRLDEEFYEELEAHLIQGDLGLELTNEIIKEIKNKKFSQPSEVKIFLREYFLSFFSGLDNTLNLDLEIINVIIFSGVNGTGKTSSIGKMAFYLKSLGYFPIISASDTFRAGAIEQIKIWGERAGVEVIAQKEGADPASVVYNTLESAKARRKNVVLIDTAGRMHTKTNLIEELKKIERIVEKNLGYPPRENLLVIDATLGQNVIRQVEIFNSALKLTGFILTKLDGTAKGGVIFNLVKNFSLPVKFVTIGESIEDLKVFNPEEFINNFLIGD
ncbi:MAG: signal recognition particle-docking protein FtsY [Dictyoglomus sp.]|nr:signal recognition particle-docking protein FtsY [Dictyoglomus sp.]MDW8188932.1 signal recognition particle-docking protein FtsY [Dictyoglomus sp.]